MDKRVYFLLLVVMIALACCGGGNEAKCQDECSAGETQCIAGSLRQCQEGDECRIWSQATPCPSGAPCESNATCQSCDECSEVGEESCMSGAMVRCSVSADDCRVYEELQACPWGCSLAQNRCDIINGGQSMVIDSVPVQYGTRSSIETDSSGVPHVVYSSHPSEPLKYAYWDGMQWRREVAAASGGWPALAIDGQGEIHVSYVSADDSIQYLHHNGTAWQVEHLGADIYSGGPAIDTLAAATPIVIYPNEGTRFMQVGTRGNAGWTIEDRSPSEAVKPSMKIDSQDGIHVVGRTLVNRHPLSYYRYTDSMGWSSLVIDQGGGTQDLDVDSGDHPHVAFSSWDQQGHVHLYYGYLSGGTWVTESVSPRAGRPSIEVAPSGTVFVVYTDYLNDQVVLATRTPSGWSYEMLAQNGHSADMAIDHFGNLHISYFALGQDELKYIMVAP